jgi:hypothetical protein
VTQSYAGFSDLFLRYAKVTYAVFFVTTSYRVPVVDDVKLAIKLGGGKPSISMCVRGYLDNFYQV